MIKIKIIFIFLLFAGCTKNNKLNELLLNKYQEEFIILDDSYSYELGLREFTASPKRFPDLKFYGRYNDSNWVYDYYAESIQSYELQKKVKDIFKESNLNIFTKCNVASGLEGEKNNKVTGLVEVLQDSKDTSIISNAVYVFENINQGNKDKLLKPIYKLLGFYNQYSNKMIYLKVYFWDEKFLIDKELDSLNFTVNVESWDESGKDLNDDNINNKRKYIRDCISLAFVTPFKTNINIDSLYSFIQPYDIKGNDKIWLK